VFRLRAASAPLREFAGPALTDAFALLTRLGGVPVLMVVLATLYWDGDRRASAAAVGYTFTGFAATLALKAWFALPRPPAAAQAVATDPGSYGFPSGHAVAATVVYGGLLVTHRRRDARSVLPVAALIALVALSRVVLGVHYLGDVIAGVAVGAAVVGLLSAAVGDRADLACLAAAACSIPAIAVAGAGPETVLALGGSLGGALAFGRLDVGALPDPRGPGAALLLVATGLGFAGALYSGSDAVAAAALPAALVVDAALVAGIAGFPLLLRVPELLGR
jgi:membrane-associated phospholipid phosphatase